MVWKTIKHLGEGGYGSVSLARSSPSPDDDHIVNGLNLPPLFAVKSAPRSTSESLEFEREILHKLRDCPNVINCFGADACSGKGGVILYNIFLQYAAGGSLADRIYSGQPLGEDEIKDYTRSILQGLKFMHGMGFVHCDIKPANILLVADDNAGGYLAKIGDLGLALEREMTDCEGCRGTFFYLAPESILHGHYGCGVDIWALGCTVFEMFVRKRLRKRNAKFAVKIPLGISKEAQDFLTKCLQVDPLLRWSADKLLKDHPFLRDADKDTEIRCTEVSSALNVDDEEFNEKMMPMKLLKRYRENVSEEDFNEQMLPMKLLKRDKEGYLI